MKQKILFRIAAMLSIPLSLWSCMAVKPYQKGKLNDAEMELSARKVERGEMGFMSYREGASGANGGKAGGGCGCN